MIKELTITGVVKTFVVTNETLVSAVIDNVEADSVEHILNLYPASEGFLELVINTKGEKVDDIELHVTLPVSSIKDMTLAIYEKPEEEE